MERTVRIEGRGSYPAAVADLWERVGVALARLERIAESPADALGDELLDELPGLQYSLHEGAELAVGIDAPRGAEELHAELVAALGEARDATAEIALALDVGDSELVSPLLPEWRGTLFRVRLARLRALEGVPLSAPPNPARQERREEAGEPLAATSWTAVAATVLVLTGAFLFTAGAVLVAWPVWTAGLTLFAGGFVLLRP